MDYERERQLARFILDNAIMGIGYDDVYPWVGDEIDPGTVMSLILGTTTSFDIPEKPWEHTHE